MTLALVAAGLLDGAPSSVGSSRSFDLVWRSTPDLPRAVRAFCGWLAASAASEPMP